MMKRKKQMREAFKQLCEGLQRMSDNPKKYWLLTYSMSREAIEDPLETIKQRGLFICHKPGPTMDIHLTIAIKDDC